MTVSDEHQHRRGRNAALLAALIGVVALVYLATMLKSAGGAG